MSEIILEQYRDEEGYQPIRRLSEAKVAQFHEVLTSKPSRISLALEAARQGIHLPIAEGVSTSDFPTLFAAVIDRELLAAYKANVPEWRSYIKTGRVSNFNQHDAHKISGQDDVLPQVAELGPYLEEPSVTGVYHRRVFKWGRKFSISFEALINDALGAFDDITTRFGTAASRTEARNATLAFCADTGPSAALYGTPKADVDGQNVTNMGVLGLSITNLAATMLLMSNQTDVNGSPISVQAAHLVVPPALEMTARQILTSAFIQQVDTFGGANAGAPVYAPLPTVNILPQMGLRLSVNRDLPVIDVSGNGNGTWYLFGDYNQGASAQLDYLRGHELPEIRMKSTNSTLVGGGSVNPLEGDFDNDSIAYRIRCINGGASLDPRFTYAQVHA